MVANRGGKKVCYVAAEKGPEEREVQTGAFNNTFVEIISGLEVGEKVLLNPPRAVRSSAESGSRERQSLAPGQEKAPEGSTEEDAASIEKPTPDTPPVATP